MATKTFALRTEPHVATIGDTELHFVPEVYGDDFLDAYQSLLETRRVIGAEGGLENLSSEKLRSLYGEMRAFLGRLMTEESAAAFIRFEVVDEAGDVIADFRTREAADACVAEHGGRVADRSVRLPDRVLVELIEWVIELYGGDSKKRPTGSSKGSSRASSRAGNPGKGSSPSTESTSTAGP